MGAREIKRLLVFFGLLAPAIACESIYVPPCAIGNEYEQIFIGTATETLSTGEFRFSVEEPLKGIPQDAKVINAGPGPCMIPYQIGSRYLMLLKSVQEPEGKFSFSTGESAETATDSIDFFARSPGAES